MGGGGIHEGEQGRTRKDIVAYCLSPNWIDCAMVLTNNQLYRIWHGGLWLKFYPDGWVKCKWCSSHKGYIINSHDGGSFHITFNGIIEIEDYLYGHDGSSDEKK